MAMNPRRITRTADHQYGYEGQWYPGVTGVLDVLDKSGPLMAWAARNTAEAAIELVQQNVGNINALDALLNTAGPAGAIKALTAKSNWKRDEAAKLGTLVHTLADDHIRGGTMEIPEIAQKHVANYAEWWKASGWVLRTSEAMLINPDYKYGGTLDLLCYDAEGRTVLADIKTGAKGVYKEAILQLRAYGDATYIETEQGFFAMPKVDRFVLLHVTADKPVRPIEVPMGALEEVAWVACLDLHQWMQTQKGRSL